MRNTLKIVIASLPSTQILSARRAKQSPGLHGIASSLVLLAMTISILSACGGSTPSGNQSTCSGACGVMKLVVSGSKSFNPDIEHGRIVTYRVTVSGEGIEQPVVAEFDGAATEGVIEGIPIGSDRQITVDAINANGAIIRQGGTGGIEVKGGKTAEVEVTLESVPIFTNLSDNNTIDNTRFIFQIFADPANPVAIEDVTSETATALTDVSTSSAQINLDVNTGAGKMLPALQTAGQHTYKLFDVVTGRSSTATVILSDGTKRRGAPFFATGDGTKPELRRRVSCGTH